MKPDPETKHAISSVNVEVSPDEVDAAGELTLKARVSCSPELDLKGLALLIKDHDGVLVGSAKLISFDGGINETGETVLRAPAKAGTYWWSVVCPARATDDLSHEEIAGRFSITVKPHATRIVVWDVPSAAVVGAKFRLKVGIKCSSGCRLEGREFAIVDNAGVQAATGRVGGDPWPDSTALYFADVEVEAPAAEGLTRWEARVAAAAIKLSGSDAEIPHEAGSSTFGVRFVPSPESPVRVRVIDREKKTPLKAASIVMHPYRTVTDDTGWAEIKVTNGPYLLMVSHSTYLSCSFSVEVAGDFTTTAELDLEPALDPSDMYN